MTDFTQLKPGDRIRITVEGVVRDVVSGAVRLKLDGANYDNNGVKAQDTVWIDFDRLTAPTARVELLEPPVDPDLLLAREWFKGNYPSVAERIDSGSWDTDRSLARLPRRSQSRQGRSKDMSPEQLDKARADEVWRISGLADAEDAIVITTRLARDFAVIAARLAREGWTPPAPISPISPISPGCWLQGSG